MRRIAMTILTLVACTLLAPRRAASVVVPELESWRINTTGVTGYGGLPANVQQVRYSTNNVYVNSSSIPDYTIGPWPGNPNTPANQNFLVRIPRHPVANTGTKTATGLGTIGVWTNGVSIYNASDARSYNNLNLWHNNAIAVEGPSFDACLGHPAPGGNYHHHENASCLYGADPHRHSALLGFAFDGFPVYGPYAYTNTDGTGPIKRMVSGYRLRNITNRQTLANGTVLTPAQYGPAIASPYVLGYFIEDYEYVAGLGDLDESNGRFAVTPEYPQGTYAYYTTVDAAGAPVYPYHIGPKYYGVVANDNITSRGHVTIAETVTAYVPTLGADQDPAQDVRVELAQSQPNPAAARSSIRFTLAHAGHVSLRLYDLAGHEVMTLMDGAREAGVQAVSFDVSRLAAGVYFYRLDADGRTRSRHLAIVH